MDDTLSVVAGALPVVGGIVSGIMNNANVDSANKRSVELQQQQQEYNTKMWQMQNAYNSPNAVMQRYKDAGLNPNLIYGGGSGTGNLAAPVAQTQVPQVHVKQAPDLAGAASAGLSAYNNMRMLQPQINNLEAHATNTVEDTLLKAVQAAATGAAAAKTVSETTGIDWQNKLNSNLSSYYIDMKNAELNKTKAETSTMLSRNDREAAMNSVSLKEAATRILEMRSNMATSSVERLKLASEIDKIKQDTSLLQMDNQLRAHGVQPHDTFWWRILANAVDPSIKPFNTVPSVLMPYRNSLDKADSLNHLNH